MTLGALAVLLAMLDPLHGTQAAAQTLSTTADAPPATIMNWAAISLNTPSVTRSVSRCIKSSMVAAHW